VPRDNVAFDDTVPSQPEPDRELPDVRAIPPRHKSAVRRTRRVNFTVLPITRIRPAGEMRLRTNRDGVPGVAARAAVAADHHRAARDHLFHADLMVCAALGTDMGHAGCFRLSEGHRSLRFFVGHFFAL